MSEQHPSNHVFCAVHEEGPPQENHPCPYCEIQRLTADRDSWKSRIMHLEGVEAERERLTRAVASEKELHELNVRRVHDRALSYMRERDRLRAALTGILISETKERMFRLAQEALAGTADETETKHG
jgi:hypothetical protein